jgi:hypothetical protein
VTEYRVTNGVIEKLYVDWTIKDAQIDFEKRYGTFNVEVFLVDNHKVYEMPQTLDQRESQIIPNFWNFCHKCKLQFCTFYQARCCHRCGHIKLERRGYNEPKIPVESETQRRNGQGNLQAEDRTKRQEDRLREHQAAS